MSYQLKLIKMSAELANINHCALPFFKPHRRQLELVRHYTPFLSVVTESYVIDKDQTEGEAVSRGIPVITPAPAPPRKIKVRCQVSF